MNGLVGIWCDLDSSLPTSRLTIMELQNPWIDEFYVVQELRATDFEAPKIVRGHLGVFFFVHSIEIEKENLGAY